MPLRFTVLASGSAGNASLLEADGFGLLLDLGLGPRQLSSRLAAANASWRRVQGALLTHTHSDHWNERTLVYLRRMRIPLYCHPDHQNALRASSAAFAALQAADLVHPYETEQLLVVSPGLRCLPLPLRHDGGATFGFRLEGADDLFGHPCALGYAADLGSWTPQLAQALAEVDVLALEFNHDVQMETVSGRSPQLINRVLGDAGHLSNAQAAALLLEVLRQTTPGRLQYLVQLHLSRDCNRPALAAQTAAAVASHPLPPEVHTARQDQPTDTFVLGDASANGRRLRAPAVRGRPRRSSKPSSTPQCWLPGLDT